SRIALHLARTSGGRAEGAALHVLLLGFDRPACAAHDHRRRPAALDHRPRVAQRLRSRVLRPGRDHGPLLALRRHRLDLPLPVPLSHPRGSPWLISSISSTRRTLTSRRSTSTSPP